MWICLINNWKVDLTLLFSLVFFSGMAARSGADTKVHNKTPYFPASVSSFVYFQDDLTIIESVLEAE